MLELLSSLAIFKITTMLMDYAGPLDTIKWFRESIEKLQTKRKVLNFECFFCLSTVVAIPFAIGIATNVSNFILYWFALSGMALLINTLYDRLER